MIKTAIIGATGYTGSELVRLLYRHPETRLELITSESRNGEKFSDVHKQFTGLVDIELKQADALADAGVDAVFLALPHGVSMEYVRQFGQHDFRIIDLSGDYRLSSPEVYNAWYSKEHVHPEGFVNSVYGLPELHRKVVEQSQLVANPGCYPTSAILALAPLMKNHFIYEKDIVIDSKSGTTGAGVKASPTTHFSNVNDNFKSYGLKVHRHTIEIEEQCSIASGEEVQVQFTPHLLPIDRGILTTVYSRPKKGTTSDDELRSLYTGFYENHPFVRVRSEPPTVKDVRGTNYCDVYSTFDKRTGRILTISVIDNLVKGAAGQAIQNMNLMFGLPETTGLEAVALNP